ncbi:MAG: hypothetical protein U0T68_01270 [Ferruginibacter sp.]
MRPYIQITFLFLFGLLSNNLFSQPHPIYAIEKKLMQGDKNALTEIAQYFDSDKELIEYLGYHRIKTNEKQVAKRLVEENCLFTETEILINNKTSKSDFLKFISRNLNKITFSNLAEAFLITPLEKRTVNVEFRDVTENKSKDLQKIKSELLNKEWVKSTNIESLIQKKDPQCLLNISSELFKIRYRFNVHHFNKNEYLNLFSLLTNLEFGVENEKKEISWHTDKDFYPESSMGLLIYFSANYKDFIWDEEKGIFVNSKIQIHKTDEETALFQQLNNDNDTIAIKAFTELTNCNPEKVTKLANEYQKADIDHNYVVGTFPYKFLKQLVQLVAVYKQKNINYSTNGKVKQLIDKLNSDISFKERRKIEDDAINQMSLNDISAFEYWSLLNESSWGITYSAGRILDIFYSKHFDEILNNSTQLNLYLKKSSLFDELGIIGVCNNYLVKFTNLKNDGISKLNLVQISDNEVKAQIEKAKTICNLSLKIPNDTKKVNDANNDYKVDNVRQSILNISKIREQEKMEDSLTEFLSKISYYQIEEALNAIDKIEFKESKWKKYSFLERDFGFFAYDNFDTISTRKEFLFDYKKYSEFDFYKNMLSKSGTDYFNSDNTLNYDKIYEALKYNVVVAFVGGGGGKQDNEVYSLIKLLELRYNTTLGYPKKICNSNGIYGCDSQDRANYWMQYLVDKKLLKEVHNAPVSFHYE